MDALTVAEAAKALRVHPQTVYRLIWAHRLKATDIGTSKRPRLRIRKATLDQFLKEQER